MALKIKEIDRMKIKLINDTELKMLKNYGYYLRGVFQIPDSSVENQYNWALQKLNEGFQVLEGNFNIISSQWEYTPMIKKIRHGGRKKKLSYEFCVKVWNEWKKGITSMTQLAKRLDLKYTDVLLVCSNRLHTYSDYYTRYKAEVVK